MLSLGIDTSNYTTSCALYDSQSNMIYQRKKLLTVKSGEIGLRQSEAVFQHTLRLPELINELFSDISCRPDVISCSKSPSEEEKSYMPCFMVGKGAAETLAAVSGKPLYCFSHQAGHIAAAAYSSGNPDILKKPFIAFHVSGGTTQALKVIPDKEKVIAVRLLLSSVDLKAGQAIDRVGRMLGLPFPAGAELDRLSRQSCRKFKIHPFSNEKGVSFSGLENKCSDMIKKGEDSCDVARYCIEYVLSALKIMTARIVSSEPGLPLLYSGGVMSNSLIKETFTKDYGAYFAEPIFSSDNAAGIAVLGAIKAGAL